MNKTKWTNLWLVILAIVMIALFIFPGYNKIESYFHKQPQKVLSKEENNLRMHERLKETYQQEAALLSAKYNADEGKVLEMLAEDFEIKLHSDDKNTKEKILNFSRKYGLPQNIIASILWDIKVLESAEEKCWTAE